MARPAKFRTDDLLDAAAKAILEHGRDASVSEVGHIAGAPTGSIYHRFSSRTELFVGLWLRSVRRFQAGFMEACRTPDARKAVLVAAGHIPRFCRDHPLDALGMTLFRQTALLPVAPESYREEVATLNDEINAVRSDLVRRRYGQVDERRTALLVTATHMCPYGLVRPYVGGDIPDWIDEAATASTEAIAALGD